ncbi:ATPase [Aliihoeflea aestuarii]|jgi:chaperone required for assembly of F1-ATPase|uniref:ATP12 family chaperone protein n=1 Tax=Aliihoeflea aestuarii TaxID=453840 RepID=UPI0020920A95|nr:ATP12 family protein [Aliihoeflea aestuarii]MCO6390693.1 ATPase [Aliihoeflea aestuarii]
MRDILSDLDTPFVSDENPMKRAQKQMRTPLPKRFYKTAHVERDIATDTFAVQLDGKPVRTPGRALLALPSEAAARLVADEFEAQKEEINPFDMPVLRIANTAIDGVATDTQAVLEDILRYSSSDLVCYRADGPESLVERQNEAWDRIVDWARASLGARFVLAEGIVHVDQPREAIGAIGIHLKMRDEPFRLSALHVMTTLTGSALIALAVDAGELTAEEGWAAAHVDEDWNIAQWGEDADAAKMRAAKKRDMLAAARLLAALN